jgi:hypothetical protein
VIGDLWDAINEAITLKDCEVYKFQPPDGNGCSLMTTWEEDDDDLLGDEENASRSTDLWSFYYLFVNKTRKRILLFTATETMKARTISNGDDDDMETEKYIGSVTDVEQDARFDLDPAASESIPISSI